MLTVFFGIRSYLFVELFPLCYVCTRKLVLGFMVVSLVGLLRDNSFGILYARVSSSWLGVELLPSVGAVLN
jgi:hypothetical protein